ncbi:MAG TPA: hypothetical protein VGL65_13825 [Gemmatimonadales bacterium]|jgi:hypothetical protein
MDLDDIKAQLDRIFASGSRAPTREQAAGLREALVEYKVGIGVIRDALARSERELESARREGADYARRGQLAGEISDAETVRIAAEFTTRTQERVDLLERKVLLQRDELAMAEREYEATRQRFQAAARGVPIDAPAADSPQDEPGMTPADQVMIDQRAKDAAVEAQLAHLKKKLGETR